MDLRIENGFAIIGGGVFASLCALVFDSGGPFWIPFALLGSIGVAIILYTSAFTEPEPDTVGKGPKIKM